MARKRKHNRDFKEKVVDLIINGNYKAGSVPDLWDGRTAQRILDILVN